MFNNKADNETDFCESYKSQILDTNSSEDGSLFNSMLKIVTILFLLAIIVAVSIYGYNYFISSQKSSEDIVPPISVQVSDDELKVIDEPIEVKEEKNLEETVAEVIQKPITPVVAKIQESDIEKIANDIKLAIAKSEEKEKNTTEDNGSVEEKNLEVPTASPEAQYLEELADLSKEIDKERK